jgi:hypothetical protein
MVLSKTHRITINGCATTHPTHCRYCPRECVKGGVDRDGHRVVLVGVDSSFDEEDHGDGR